MCRLAAYLGPSLPLQPFLLDPPHSLLVQAWAPQELVYARLNADGYGFGWYRDDSSAAVYTNPMPIWSDPNLPALAASLESPLWLGFIRSATEGSPVSHANTQPFMDQELMFMHNGYVEEFAHTLRPTLVDRLSAPVAAGIRGNTDSEYLFALLRQLLLDDAELSIEAALAALYLQLDDMVGTHIALLNLVVSEGKHLYAARHAFNHASPSLYYTTDDDTWPGAQLVASERLTESDFWQPVPEHHLLVLAPDEPPELIAL